MDYDALVGELAVKDRAQAALAQLMGAASAATDAVRRGLLHDDPTVRVRCCVVLDHHLDEAALPELIANLDHPEGKVRAWALHALACDRCKEGECRPGEDEVLPIALRMLADDRSRRVRTMAAQLLGPAAPRRADVQAALIRARDTDRHPVVRKVAGWYAPGGACFRRFAG